MSLPRPKRGPLPFSKLAEEGLEYQTWLVNPRVLLPQLVRDLNRRNVYRRALRLENYNDFFGLLHERIVINCTGVAAGGLARDAFVRPVRGQIAIFENPNPERLNYFFSGGCGNDVTYLFCRQNDIIVGGTWEPGITSTVADEQLIGTVINRASRIFAGDTMRCLPPTIRPG